MSNELLYNKYRPRRFDEVAGQEHITGILKGLLLRGGIKNAHVILSGSPGGGKTTTARILSRAINCTNLTKEGEPCNTCDNCTKFLTGQYGDYIEVDGTSYNKVEDAKRLVDLASQYPINPKGQRVIMIDEAHALSNAAFDKFLLLLESADVRTTFIFSTTDLHLFRPAIVSRCYSFNIKPLGTRDVANELLRIVKAEGKEYTAEAINKIAFQYSGKPRDAVKTLGMHLTAYGNLTTYTETTQESVLLQIFKLAYFNKVEEYLEVLERVDTGNIYRNLTRMLNEMYLYPNLQPILIKAEDIESFNTLVDKKNLKQIIRDVITFKPDDPYSLQLFLTQITDLGFKLQTKVEKQSKYKGRRFVGSERVTPIKKEPVDDIQVVDLEEEDLPTKTKEPLAVEDVLNSGFKLRTNSDEL